MVIVTNVENCFCSLIYSLMNKRTAFPDVINVFTVFGSVRH